VLVLNRINITTHCPYEHPHAGLLIRHPLASFPTRTAARSGCASIKAVAALERIYKAIDADAGQGGT
jgi:hypothetical protein